VHAAAEGYAPCRRDVHLEPGRENDVGDLALQRLAPGLRISGTMRGPDGKPAWIAFELLGLDDREGEGPPPSTRTAMSLPDGSFVVDHLAAGRYALVPAEGDWAREPVEIDARHGSVEHVFVQVRPGTPVTFRPEPGVTGAIELRVLAPGGLPVFSGGVGGGTGAVTLPLAPGRYDLALGRGPSTRTLGLDVGSSAVEVPVSRGD
jgi:hypothetical protein